MTDLHGDYNIIGPPGCGKTTSLAAQTRKLVEEYGSDSVLIASLTRAAAAEIAGRKLPIPRTAVGTLHSHCFHALGTPPLVADKMNEWNSTMSARFQMTESGGENIDDAFPERAGRLPGDLLLQEYQLLRVKMIEKAAWPTKIQNFSDLFEHWKNENGYFDFVDLIDYSLKDIDKAPGEPSFLVVDESQDMDLMAVQLIRKWSQHAQATIYAGDAWQCQLPGTLVSTTNGQVPIEELDILTHRIVSYDVWKGILKPKGFPFFVKKEQYNGPLYTIRAGPYQSSYNSHHLCIIRDTRRYLTCRTIEAAYVPTGGFEVPIITGDKVEWVAATRTEGRYDGPIFSLKVLPYETYVGDGIITHNCIFSWRGSDYSALDYIQNPSHVKVLEQSYRLPRSVHRYAIGWMAKHLDSYKEIIFKPRDEEGSVEYIPKLNYKTPLQIADLAASYIEQNKRVMVLGSCGYHVYDIVAALKKNGIPYHNPYSKNGYWNPLHVGRGTSISERILSFLGSNKTNPKKLPWSVEDLQNFVEIVKADGVLIRGAKKYITDMNPTTSDPFTLDDMEGWFTREAGKALMAGNLEWLEEHIIESKKKQSKYAFDIIKRYGIGKLSQVSQRDKDLPGSVIIGTVHSVKGGEADIIIISPDISLAGYKMWKGSPQEKSSVARLFYVGMTRAKEKLILLGTSGRDPSIIWPSIEE